MADENIPEVRYNILKQPKCPICESALIPDDPGCWYCEDPDCNYSEYNNITACQGECGRASLVLSRDMNFDRLEDRYCQIDYEGITCLGIAQAQSDQAEYEDQQMIEHIKHCQDDNCDCRNY